MDNADECVWHADPAEVSKSVEELQRTRASPEVRAKNKPVSELLNGANFSNVNIGGDISLRNTALRETDFSGADLEDIDLTNADLTGASLSRADLTNADLTGASLSVADLTGAYLSADLTGAYLFDANLAGAFLSDANLTGASLSNANLTGASLSNANLTDAYLFSANPTDAYLKEADLTDADLRNADLTDADLSGADLTDANLERATLVGVNLFDAKLTNITPYGARIEAVQINDGTIFQANRSDYQRWWQRGLLGPPPRCGYDPAVEQPEQAADTDREKLLTKAADTYRQFEEIVRQNAQPSLQSSMFVLRQDMQRKRYRERGQYGQAVVNRLFRILFKHGESFGRVLLSAGAIILLFAGVYWQGDLILANPDAAAADQMYLDSFFDALYFSTLTFTTLGLGDFQPAPAAQLGRALVLLEAVMGAVLIATFVFVLGRRAAR